MDIGWWWCCLNGRERGVLRGTIIGITETLNVGIPKPLWDVLWVPFDGHGDEVKAAFLRIYGLELVTSTDPETDEEVTLVRALDGFKYVTWAVFILTPSAACIGGCSQSTVG